MSTADLVPSQAWRVTEGPALLAGIGDGPSLAGHRRRYGDLPDLSADTLIGLARRVRLRGRGGAGFPLADKLAAAGSRRRAVLVVNLAEGEPASAKDAALATERPHLVLDGISIAAAALGAREVHLVLPGDRPTAVAALRAACVERERAGGAGRRERARLHVADASFVAGESSAVLELMAGRPNLPVTTWAPAAHRGHRGRPTVFANAETWAQLGLLALVGEAAYARHGTAEEPGTTLLTIVTPGATPHVVEAAFGTALVGLLPVAARGAAVAARRLPRDVGDRSGPGGAQRLGGRLPTSWPGPRRGRGPLGRAAGVPG